jgi:DNA-binding transcriptional LysR family regulator
MRIDPRLIVEFCIIAEEASFTRAAERLRVAQPWLSTRLRRLEALIGYPLLERSTRTVGLTDRGSALLPAAQALARAHVGFEDLALQLLRDQSQTLRLGAPPYTKHLAKRRAMIDGFTAAHPGVRFELHAGWSQALQERLRGGDIDLALVVGPYDAAWFEAMELGSLGLALTVARDHELAGRAITADDLRGREVNVYTRSLNPLLWDTFYASLRAAGAILIERPEVAEGGFPEMVANDPPSAFLDLGVDEPTVATVRPILDAAAPLHLLRRGGDRSELVGEFWRLARLVAEPNGHDTAQDSAF